MVNAWHDLDAGKKAPEVVQCVVEIPKDSTIKYELHKETGMLMLDRYMFSAMHYPVDYGFIPQTYCDDNDPLDIAIFTGRPTFPLTICQARVIGAVRMVDGGEQDDKILAIHEGDPRYKEWKSIKDVPAHFIDELKHFWTRYKELEKKKVEIFETLDRKEALKIIEEAMALYKKDIKPTLK